MAFVGFESLNDEIFQTQLKAKYKSKIFIGNFKEKRLVESLKCYRDAILIETTQEKEFAKDLCRKLPTRNLPALEKSNLCWSYQERR